jgi:hypothetical protein
MHTAGVAIAGNTSGSPVLTKHSSVRNAISGPNTICGRPGKKMPRLLKTSAGSKPIDFRAGLIVTQMMVMPTIQAQSLRVKVFMAILPRSARC